MSTLQLQKIEKIEADLLHILSVEDLENFAKNLLNKAKSFKNKKRKINIGDPEHPFYNKLRPSEVEGLKEAMEDYKAGRVGPTLSSSQEIEDYFDKLTNEALYNL